MRQIIAFKSKLLTKWCHVISLYNGSVCQQGLHSKINEIVVLAPIEIFDHPDGRLGTQIHPNFRICFVLFRQLRSN